MDKIHKFIKDNLGIDSGRLTGEDAKKLAVFVLRAISLETPRIAEISAKELGLKI